MAKVIGFNESNFKIFICEGCYAVVQYTPIEDKYTDKTDEGTKIRGLHCPSCGSFNRTNP